MSEEQSRPKVRLRRSTNVDESYANVTVTPAKRQRVSRACDQCRAAREKCDGIQPLCFACASQNRRCSYTSNPKKRGIQPGYIRTLELSLAWVFDKIPGSEEALNTLLTHEGGQGQSLLIGKSTDDSHRLHKRWRKSAVHKEIDRMLSGSEGNQDGNEKDSPAEDSENETEPDHSVPANEQKQCAQNLTPESLATELFPDIGVIDTRSRTIVDEQKISQLGNSTRKTSMPQLKTKLPRNQWKLIDAYFAYTHCWFPILEKHDLLKCAYSYPEQGLNITAQDGNLALHAELWAALALASMQIRVCAGGSSDAQQTTDDLETDDIYATARSLIPFEDGDFRLSHVKAFLLLTLVNIGQRNMTAAWISIGNAVRIALIIGINAQQPQYKDSSRATHTFMGCFMLDILISVQLQQPAHLRPEYVEGLELPSEDGLEEWQPWTPGGGGFNGKQAMPTERSPAHTLSVFNRLFSLLRYLATIFPPKEYSTRPLQNLRGYVGELQNTLGHQTPYLRFVISGESTGYGVPPLFTLRFCYLCLRTLLEPSTESMSAVIAFIEHFIQEFGMECITPFVLLHFQLVFAQISPNLIHPRDKTRGEVLVSKLLSAWQKSSSTSRRAPIFAPSAFNVRPDISYQPRLFTMTNTTVPLQTPTPSNTFSNTQNEQISSPQLYFSRKSPSQAEQAALETVQSEVQAPTSSLNPISSLVDYDSLLDDFAAIDSADQFGTDPNFMQNLGYAPGSDLSDLLAADFSGFEGWTRIHS
jgi:hypothetical protein